MTHNAKAFVSLTQAQISSLLEPNASSTPGTEAYQVLVEAAASEKSPGELYEELRGRLATEAEPGGELYALGALTTFYAGREQRKESDECVGALIELSAHVWSADSFYLQRHLAELLQMFGVSLVRDRDAHLKGQQALAELCSTVQRADALFIASCQARDCEGMAELARASPEYAPKWSMLAGELGDAMNAESGTRWHQPHVSNAIEHGFWPSRLYERPDSVKSALIEAARKKDSFMTGDMADHLLAGFIHAAGVEAGVEAASSTPQWRALKKVFTFKPLEPHIPKAPNLFRREWMEEAFQL